MYERFTDRARKVMQLANQEAQRFNHEYVGTEHVLLGLVKEGVGVAANVLKNLDIDLHKIRLEVEKIVHPGPGSPVSGKLPQTPKARKVIEYSVEEARNLNHNYVGTEHLLLGLLREQEGVAAQVLMNLGLRLEDVREEVLNLLGHNLTENNDRQLTVSQRPTPLLAEVGRDLTELARQGRVGPVTGWTNELERVLQVLSRRTKNNPLLLGETCVGKTVIVEALALIVAHGHLPAHVCPGRIVALDPPAAARGLKPRQVRELLEGAVREASQAGNVLLYLSDLHLGGADDRVLAPLAQALARGQVRCIAAAEGPLEALAPGGALAHCFEVVAVRPLSKHDAVEVLRGLRGSYEAHHQIQIKDEALLAAVEQSDRHLSGCCLPDKAIDVLDEAGARVRLKALTRPPDLKELEAQIEQLNKEKEAAIIEQDFEKAARVQDCGNTLRKQKKGALREWRDKAKGSAGVVDEGVVAEVVGRLAGVPVHRPGTEEARRLLNLEADLQERVIGQADALRAVAQVVRRARAGLRPPDRPIANLVFAGPTGVGKTLLARRLAALLFGDEGALVRLDMGQFSHQEGSRSFFHTLERTAAEPSPIPQPPELRVCKVLLLEGVELAHCTVRGALLQVMGGQWLGDGGRLLDFKNALVILTTGVGRELLGGLRTDEARASDEKKARYEAELSKAFRPEFLSRLDDVVVFHPLGREHLKQILSLELAGLAGRLEGRGLTLVVPAAVKDYLLDQARDSESGARSLRRAVEQHLEAPLTEELLKGTFAGKGPVEPQIQEVRSVVFRAGVPGQGR